MEYCYNSISWYKVNLRNGKLGEVRLQILDQLEDDKRTCTKTINNAQVQDSGLYYCASAHDKMLFIGNGTRVVVTDTGPLNLSVVVYTPVVEEVEEDDPSVLLQCVVMDTVPSQVRVWWLVDDEEHTGWTESGWTGQDDSASEYTRAQIRITAEEWSEATIECVVNYKNQTVSRTVPRPSHSVSCAWLLYGGCTVAIFTIAVAITVVLCLRKEKRILPAKRHSDDVDTRRKHRAKGKQETLRNNLQKPAEVSEVEYSFLNPEIFKRQPPPPPINFE
ncbi:uncharacterized protein LOC131362419 isoform X2 [Hemibagrus wyckioides]|nr:uncharacterized protein LOC131362419 isoform X2 [Hemibagrus wyckioides]